MSLKKRFREQHGDRRLVIYPKILYLLYVDSPFSIFVTIVHKPKLNEIYDEKRNNFSFFSAIRLSQFSENKPTFCQKFAKNCEIDFLIKLKSVEIKDEDGRKTKKQKPMCVCFEAWAGGVVVVGCHVRHVYVITSCVKADNMVRLTEDKLRRSPKARLLTCQSCPRC